MRDAAACGGESLPNGGPADRVGVDIAADTVVRLAESCPNIVSIKEASGSVDRVSELVGRVPVPV